MHEDEDDWAPLPPEQLTLRPGEQNERAAGQAPCPAADTRPSATPPAAATATPPTARGLRALQELEQRLCRARRGDSLIAQLQQRELRGERQRLAAERATPQLSATVVAVTEPVRDPAALAVDAHASDLDERELEPWFRELPQAEQARLQALWHDQRHRYDHLGLARRRRLARAFGYGALVFLLLGLSQSLLMGGFGLLPMLVLGGAGAAFLAECLGGGRFIYSFAGAATFVVTMGPMVILQPLGLCSLLFATYGLGLIGMDGEMRRSAGYRDA